MTFQKRLVMILAIALCAGGLYAAGRLGMTVHREETEEPVEESFFGHRRPCICGMRTRRSRII